MVSHITIFFKEGKLSVFFYFSGKSISVKICQAKLANQDSLAWRMALTKLLNSIFAVPEA